jgi:hypothetical protein
MGKQVKITDRGIKKYFSCKDFIITILCPRPATGEYFPPPLGGELITYFI